MYGECVGVYVKDDMGHPPKLPFFFPYFNNFFTKYEHSALLCMLVSSMAYRVKKCCFCASNHKM